MLFHTVWPLGHAWSLEVFVLVKNTNFDLYLVWHCFWVIAACWSNCHFSLWL